MRRTNLISRFLIFALAIFTCAFLIFPTGAAEQESNARDESAFLQSGVSGNDIPSLSGTQSLHSKESEKDSNAMMACVAAPSGLVAWYRGENNANDAAGTRDGTMEDAATFGTGQIGQAFSFDGTSGAVFIPRMNLGRDYTIEFWLYAAAENTGSYRTVIANNGENGSDDFNAIYTRNNSTFLNLWNVSGGGGLSSAPNSISPGSWRHIAVTYHAFDPPSQVGEFTFFINGIPSGSPWTVYSSYDDSVRLGGYAPGGGIARLAGKMDEVSFYNRALTQAEITSVAAASSEGKCAGNEIPTLSISDATVTEGNSGTTNADFAVTLSSGSAQTVTVNYATQDTTASAGTDYTTTSGTLTFAPGETTKTVSVPVTGDTTDEANETFKVTLSGSANASINDGEGTGTITDDDEPVTACIPAPANLQVFVPGENSPSDVQSVNTNASLIGDATYDTGKVGKAFKFDGDGDYVRIEDNAAQKPVNQLTVEGWFNLSSVTNQALPHLVTKPLRNSAENSYALWYNGSLRIGYKPIGAGFIEYATGYQPPLNVWNHYAFVLNTDDAGEGANTAKLYVNGVEVFSGAATNPVYYNGINDANAPHPLLIGAEFESNNSQWGMLGRADEISVYGRALSQSEIFGIVQQGSFGKCPPTNCVQTPNNLVSWFAGEQNALDSKSNNHGANNGATFTTGKVGQAFNFDGSGQYVNFGNTLGNFGTSDFSVELWLQTSTGRQEEILSKRSCGAAGVSYFHIRKLADGTILAELNQNGGSGVNLFGTRNINDGIFHHIAVRRSGDTLALYVDGVLDVSGTGAAAINLNNSAPFVIGALGCIGLDPSQPFTGKIDEVSVYDRALSTTEISSIYNAGQSGKCKPVGLTPPANQIAWFTGDGDRDGDMVNDAPDFLGLNPDGILRGNANFRVGKVGQAFNLDGNGDYIEVADDADHRPATQLTAEGWFKFNNFNNSPHLIAKGLRGNDRNSYVMWYQNGNIRIGYSDSSSNFIFYDTGFVPNVGEFNHYALVLNTDDAGANANTLKLYVGGREIFSGAAAGPIYYDTVNPHPLTIGADINNDVPDFPLNGQADEISLYSRALSASEIAAVYNAAVAGKLKERIVNVFLRARVGEKQTAAPEALTTVELSDATITFRQLTSSGVVSQSGVDLGLLPPLPFIAGRFTGLAYDFSTTAAYRQTTDDDVEVCFNLPSLAASNVNSLRIYHLETVAGTPTWVNRTAVGNTLASFCTAGLRSLSPFVITELAPTAAAVSLSGRATSGKRGVRNALVTLTDASGATRTVLTGTNGTYRFTNIAAGQNVVLTISAKRFTFVPNTQVVNVTESLEDVNFRTQEAELSAP